MIYIPLVIIKGSLVRKLLSHGRLSWLAFPPSCQPHNHVNHHYQVVGKCNSSEARNPSFFRVMWLLGSPKWSRVVPRLDLGKLSTKSAQDCSESSISCKNRLKNWGVRSSPGFVWSSPQCQCCANVGRFGATLLLCGFATSCDRTHWHGCAQQGMSDAATLLARGIAAGGS